MGNGGVMVNWEDFRPLLMEKTGKNEKNDGWDFSLGRITFWTCFISAVYFWLYRDIDIHPSHMQMLYIAAVYNLAKKMPQFGGMINISGNMNSGNVSGSVINTGDNPIMGHNQSHGQSTFGGNRPDIHPPRPPQGYHREGDDGDNSPNLRDKEK